MLFKRQWASVECMMNILFAVTAKRRDEQWLSASRDYVGVKCYSARRAESVVQEAVGKC